MSDDRLPDDVLTAESDQEGLRIVRILDAPREEVFRAWTEPEAFARWFGEHGSTVPVDAATMDVRPGGAWRAVMIIGPDSEKVFSGHYREVDEPAHLVLTITDLEPPDPNAYEVLTVDLDDLGDGRTQMTFTQRGGNVPPDLYEMTLRGWLVFFDRQAELLKGRHDTDLKARHDTDT
ncbi:MAG: SRPBCC family protein [Actinomycetota bacterium]